MILWFNDNGNCLSLFSLSRIASPYEMMRCQGSDLEYQYTCRNAREEEEEEEEKREKRVHIKILIVRLSRSMAL